MDKLFIFPEDSFRTTAWSGGTTTELFLWPEDGSYKDRRFSVRISTALVELEESDFTPLPGVKRFLTPLSRGFLLSVNGKDTDLPVGEVLEFSGDDRVKCFGSGRDLNLMLKGAEGEMTLVSGAFTVPECERAFLFAKTPQTVSFCCDEKLACTSAYMPARSFAEIMPGGCRTDGEAALFLIRRY